jgi:hypothetical protein
VSKVIGPEVNAEKTKYIAMFHEHNAGEKSLSNMND